MTRINTNVASMIAQNNLAKSNKDMSVSLQRLSTGLAINRGADDPAGLIVSERLRSEIKGVGQAVDNAERASNVIATAEGALDEISRLLIDMQSLVVESANTGAFSKEEVEANQLQIDSAIDSITRISNTTSFAGLKLLNGSLDYELSDVDSAAISDVAVRSANFAGAPEVPVSVDVVEPASQAELFIDGTTVEEDVTIEVQGRDGVEVFNFKEGMNREQMLEAINAVKDATGVAAEAHDDTWTDGTPAEGIRLYSADFGSEAFVSVQRRGGDPDFETHAFNEDQELDPDNTAVRARGEDVLALVNGHLALGDGLDLSMHSTMLAADMTLEEDFASRAAFDPADPPSSTFKITGGGAKYQIGPSVNVQQQASFSIQSVAASRLGDSKTGFLSSIRTGGDNALIKSGAKADEQAGKASDIIDKAVDQVSVMRGRLGAFERNTLDTTIRSQQIALENLTSAESTIRDTDFAEETSKLTRAQILNNAGTSTLAMANNTAQNVLQLLG